jgi:hypothetical protein
MRTIDASGMDFTVLNELLRAEAGSVELHGCLGQRFIGAGMSNRKISIHGVPGNALGAYLNGGTIEVFGNAQDAVGDTMNAGTILVHGSIGDTAGYAMRGGKIYVRGDAGYRTGIHMKAYQEHLPVIIIGGRAGTFLGNIRPAASSTCWVCTPTAGPSSPISPARGCTGKAVSAFSLRGRALSQTGDGPPAAPEDLGEIAAYLREYCGLFGLDCKAILDAPFTVVTPDSANPYQQMYVAN